MKIKNESSAQDPQDENKEVDHQPLIELFELLLEWDVQDVQEKAEKRKEVS